MNPWLILAAVLFWGVSVTIAFFQGESREADRAKAEYSKQQDAAIKEANDNALIDMQAAREVGEREGRAKVITRTITNEVTKVIHEKPSPAVCRWDDNSSRLLQRAVEAANNLEATPKPVPDSGARLKPPGKP